MYYLPYCTRHFLLAIIRYCETSSISIAYNIYTADTAEREIGKICLSPLSPLPSPIVSSLNVQTGRNSYYPPIPTLTTKRRMQ